MKKIIFNDNIIDIIESEKDLIKDYNSYYGCDDEKSADIIINDNYYNLIEAIHLFDAYIDYQKITCVACLGLWYGRRKASKDFKTLYDAITCGSYDYNKIYFEKANTTLTKESIHHDGVNYYKYYYVKGGKRYAITLKLLEGNL